MYFLVSASPPNQLPSYFFTFARKLVTIKLASFLLLKPRFTKLVKNGSITRVHGRMANALFSFKKYLIKSANVAIGRDVDVLEPF